MVDSNPHSQHFLKGEQLVALHRIIGEYYVVDGGFSLPTLHIRPQDICLSIAEQLSHTDINLLDIRVNGSTVAAVLVPDEVHFQNYSDLDLCFCVDFDLVRAHQHFQTLLDIVVNCLRKNFPVDFTPQSANIPSSVIQQSYVSKLVKVYNNHGNVDCWSLISLRNDHGRNLEFKFAHTLRRECEFSMDSFQIILNDNILHLEEIIEGACLPEVEVQCMYDNYDEAFSHLKNRLIAIKSPEEVRGGGLLKYCRLLAKGYEVPADMLDAELVKLEITMCTRFFIDFSSVEMQYHAINTSLRAHRFETSKQMVDFVSHVQHAIDNYAHNVSSWSWGATFDMLGIIYQSVLSHAQPQPSYIHLPLGPVQFGYPPSSVSSPPQGRRFPHPVRPVHMMAPMPLARPSVAQVTQIKTHRILPPSLSSQKHAVVGPRPPSVGWVDPHLAPPPVLHDISYTSACLMGNMESDNSSTDSSVTSSPSSGKSSHFVIPIKTVEPCTNALPSPTHEKENACVVPTLVSVAVAPVTAFSCTVSSSNSEPLKQQISTPSNNAVVIGQPTLPIRSIKSTNSKILPLSSCVILATICPKEMTNNVTRRLVPESFMGRPRNLLVESLSVSMCINSYHKPTTTWREREMQQQRCGRDSDIVTERDVLRRSKSDVNKEKDKLKEMFFGECRKVISGGDNSEKLAEYLDKRIVEVDEFGFFGNSKSEGQTLLMVASKYGRIQIVLMLLNHYKASVNVAGGLGRYTALHYAAFHNHGAVVKILLEHGADYTMKTAEGETAEMSARHVHNEWVTKLLEAKRTGLPAPSEVPLCSTKGGLLHRSYYRSSKKNLYDGGVEDSLRPCEISSRKECDCEEGPGNRLATPVSVC